MAFSTLVSFVLILSSCFAKAEPTRSARIMQESLGAQIKIVSDSLIATGDLDETRLKLQSLQAWIEKTEILKDFKNSSDLTLHARMKRDLHILTQLIEVLSQLTAEKLEEMLVKRRYDRAEIRDLYSAVNRGELTNVSFHQNILRKKSWIDKETDKERIRNIRWEVSEQLFSQIGNLLLSQPVYPETYETISWAINRITQVLLEVFPPTGVHLAINHQMIDVLFNSYKELINRRDIGPETKRMLHNLGQAQGRHPFLQLQIRALLKNASDPDQSTAPDEKDLKLYEQSLKAFIFKEKSSQNSQIAPFYFIPGQYMYLSQWISVERDLQVIEKWLQHHGQTTQKWSPQIGTSPEGVEEFQNMMLQNQAWPCLQLLSTRH